MTDEHRDLLHRYLRFFRLKRESVLKEITLTLKDAKKDLDTDLYSKEDVDDILTLLQNEIVTSVEGELQSMVGMSGVFLQIILSQAEQNSITMDAEVSYMENYKSLEEIKNFEKMALEVGKKPGLRKKATIGMAKLPALGGGGYNNDPLIMTELAQNKEQNQKLKVNIKKFQDTIKQLHLSETQLMEFKKMTDIEKEFLEGLEEQKEDPKGVGGKKGKNVFEMGGENASTDEIRKRDQEIMALKKELDQKINKTSQVTAMKKMLQQKNAKIKELSQKLEST